MSKPKYKLTQWHKGTDKPVRDGVYQREYASSAYYCKFEKGDYGGYYA